MLNPLIELDFELVEGFFFFSQKIFFPTFFQQSLLFCIKKIFFVFLAQIGKNYHFDLSFRFFQVVPLFYICPVFFFIVGKYSVFFLLRSCFVPFLWTPKTPNAHRFKWILHGFLSALVLLFSSFVRASFSLFSLCSLSVLSLRFLCDFLLFVFCSLRMIPLVDLCFSPVRHLLAGRFLSPLLPCGNGILRKFFRLFVFGVNHSAKTKKRAASAPLFAIVFT